ncbi:THAP domain containing 12a [Corythoichthys intestinalis]|uniref:THAP domain containing 12a n=1 Tax=Corythoichthys intestinalis TaxID=161448 RepID=UPI0025A502C6|nr:THAP domain containing 12a [Corythoichthys intestinalis]XP_061801043.1 52 kDa repressor of the inhibitor of the protein kinase-like [Nerophis lumbriciformis]
MHNQCSAPNCTSSKSDLYSLFRFPLDAERSKIWVEKCQREDLKDKSPEHLFRYYRLCAKHFENCDDASDPVTVLKDDAVPTIFDEPNKLPQVKRSKETDEDQKTNGRKKVKSSPPEVDMDKSKMAPEDLYKDYLRSLFESLVLLGEQNIPVSRPKSLEQDCTGLDNFKALLEYRINCGDEGMKKYCASTEVFPSLQLEQLIKVCERCVRSKVMKEVKENGFFSLITDELVKISDEWYLPVFLRYVNDSNYQRERFVGFLSFDGDADVLSEKLLSEMINDWGLNMEQCRGQAHSCSGIHYAKIKAFASRVLEKYPMAMLTVRPTHALNISLANSMALSGVQLVMFTLQKIESFFNQSPLLRMELEHAISVIHPDKEDKAKELKEACSTSWTKRHDAFEVTLELLEALLLCVDSVHDNEDLRWSDQITYDALEISKALSDFEFIMALVVLKNTMILLRAFGKNIQGDATDTYFAAGSLKAVLHSLTEVSDNIDVYHEFWTEEAVNLSSSMEIPVEFPRSLLRKHQSELGALQPENYYKEHLTVPLVKHTLKEVSELFNDEHLKALRCLSLVPAVILQNKPSQPDEENMLMYKNDIPNAGSLSAELHCWWVKWNKKGKVDLLISSLQETLQQADVKFFPNMLAVLRLLGVLPTFALDSTCDVAYKRFKMYMQNTPDAAKSKSLALLNINSDVGYDLDSMVDIYMKTYPSVEDAS